MRKKLKTTKRALSILALSSVLVTTALPQSTIFAQAATNPVQQSVSSGTFNAEEVNRILNSLTPEQKANINTLTGANITQKIHVDPKDLNSSKPINVIVQFKVDPAKIQIIKQSLVNGGVGANSQAFTNDYAEAQQKVQDSHAKFKSFVTTQPTQTIVGGKTVNSSMRITREYSETFNGVALTLPASEVGKIANNSEVASVWSSTEFTIPEKGNDVSAADSSTGGMGNPTVGLSWLGIDKLQAEGHTGIIKSGPRQGQAVKVAVLDTGIDYNHPDLKAVYKGGHDFVNNTVDASGAVTYVDDLDPMETTYQDWVDAKSPTASYKDYITEHGTHVSGTIAANTTNNNAIYSANGVAPKVDLYGYRVLGPGGSGSTESVLSGIDQSAIDHMDVINLSLGNTVNDPLYPTSIAINNATIQGVTCMIAAGNAGPGQGTVGSPGTSALAITVGASTIPESIPVMTIKNGSTSYQARLFGKSFLHKDDEFNGQTIPIVDVGLGAAADYRDRNMNGKIALVKRGGEFMQTKIKSAHDSGAKGMIIWDNVEDADNQGYIPVFLGVSMDHTYSVSLTQAQGQALANAIAANPNAATITFPTVLDAPKLVNGDELANFSSTGPVHDWTIKPDIVAPGVDILSTAPFDVYEPQDAATADYTNQYMQMSGTSMATPHAAGIAALVKAAHPDYSPADIKTALMNTAKDANTTSKTYSVYQVGAGIVDPARAIKSDVRIQVLDKTTTFTTLFDNTTVQQVDNLTGSIFFGYKGRGEGATNGSDDVVSSKDFNVSNKGTSSKTFNVSSKFITTRFAGSHSVGAGTGNDLKIDFSTGGNPVTSITVGGNSVVKTTAQITIPSNSVDGNYEGYINLVNAGDPSESYRIPFTVIVSEKGIGMHVDIKAFTLPFAITGNWNPDTNGSGGSYYSFLVTSKMESLYMVLKDKSGNYLGVIQNLSNISGANPGVIYGPNIMLSGGVYLPFSKPYTGTLDPSGIANKVATMTEGAYSVEMIATDAAGKRYTAEDTLYVDTTPPTIKMDSDAQPGIYEIDPEGYQAGQEIQSFYGTIYDSNIEIMKNNGETSLRSSKGNPVPAPVDQAFNTVWGYQDSYFPTVTFNTDAHGRFHFGVSKEDLTPQGTNFWIYPSDYAGAADTDSTTQQYYFIKKGSPYIAFTSSNGVDAGPQNQDKTVVDAGKPFKATFALKNATGMTGAKLMLNSKLYTFTNIRLSDEYKSYLQSKGINNPNSVLTVSAPFRDDQYTGDSINVKISGIDPAGALDHDMNVIEADVTYTNHDPLSGPWFFRVFNTELTLSGTSTTVPAFGTNVPYIRQATSLITGGLFPDAFRANTLSGSFANISLASGAKVTVTDKTGKQFMTDTPTSDNNKIEYQGNTVGTYAVTVDASDKAYDMELSMPGHFKGYLKSPVIGSEKFGYRTGDYKDIRSNVTPSLLGGDVNGDNVIDMKDAIAEIRAYLDYKNLTALGNPVQATAASKTEFLNTNRNANIYWMAPATTVVTAIDYNDFYFIFKNFGKVNQNAVDAGKITAPTPQLTVEQDTTIATPYGGTITLNAGDDMKTVLAKLNFAGPVQTTSVTTLPTLSDLKNGATISLIPSSTVFLDDAVWRNAITKVLVGSTDVTDKVTITESYSYFDGIKGLQFVPSKITLPGSLFPTSGAYAVKIQATGYQDVTKSFSIAAVTIPTPTIPLVTDPTKAKSGNDLTLTFNEDAAGTDWRQGINKVVVKSAGFSAGVDITDLLDGSGNKYYDISQSGQITFKEHLFKTNASPIVNASAINPGGASYMPQLYKFEINSTGASGTIYPLKTVGTDSNGIVQQAVGYGVYFDTQGGDPVNPLAVGFIPNKTRVNGDIISNQAIVTGYKNPSATRSGYALIGWFNDQAGVSQWDPSATITGNKTVYAKWQMSFTQNYAPVVKGKTDGLKFDGKDASLSGKGWVLGEGDLEIGIAGYASTMSWLTEKSSIQKIEATFNKIKSDGTAEATPTTYTLDPSTYDFVTSGTLGKLTFKTATSEAAALAGQTSLGQKFAFSEAPYNGYQLKVTAIDGTTTIAINDVKLAYRRHIDLNGGTLKSPSDTTFRDTLVTGKASLPDMVTKYDEATGKVSSGPLLRVTNGELSLMPELYLDAAGTKGNTFKGDVALKDSVDLYLNWAKTPPTLIKQTIGNTVGSPITLRFAKDDLWKNNITKVMIGSRKLISYEEDQTVTHSVYEYTISEGAITLNASLFTSGQKVNVVVSSEGYADAKVIDQAIGYLVTFDSNGGEVIAPQIVTRGVTRPEDPTKVDYKFAGWYTDVELTERFDFASIVKKPTTLYAKYSLAAAIVSVDDWNNAVGNDITLEFSNADWAHAINEVKVAGITVSAATYYNVYYALGTITFDKSLFTKAGNFNITISATDYADVTVNQEIVNGFNVHFVLDSAPFIVQDQIVTRRITQPVVTGYDTTWFADEAHTMPWEFTSSIYSDKTLYGNWIIKNYTVIFDRQDGSVGESITADYNSLITAPTEQPTRTGYTFYGWYKDAAGTMTWNFATDVVTADTIIYAKWVQDTVNTSGGSDPIVVTPPQTSDVFDSKVVTNPDGTKQLEVKMSSEQAAKAITAAISSGSSDVHLVIPDDSTVSSQNVDLSSDAIKALAGSGKSLSISTSKVELNIPSQSLNHASGEVNFTIEPVSEEDKQQISDQASKQATIKVVAGNNPVNVIGQPMSIDTNLQNTPVTLTLPLGDLSADQLKDLAIYIEHSDGTKELVQAELVTQNGKKALRFTTNKFSTFSVVQIAGVDKYFSVKTKAYVHGYPDGTFQPSGKITRAEVASILAQISTKTASGTAMTFTDIATDYWAMNAITTVTQMGLMNGYGDNTFRGDQEITRAELTSIIARLLGSSDTAAASKFSDIAGHWAKAAIDQVAAAGMINGYEDGTFKPSNSLTRAEAVTMINHYLGRELTTSVTAPTWSDVPATHWAYKEIESASHDQ